MKANQTNNLAALVKALRQRSGAGVLDCKRALVATNNEVEAAWQWLRIHGKAAVAKKQGHVTAAGAVFATAGSTAAVVFALHSETDFVVRNDQFLALAAKIGTVLTASAPATAGLNWGNWPVSADQTINDLIADHIRVIGENIVLKHVHRITKDADISFSVYNHHNHRLAAVCVFRGVVTDQTAAVNVAMHVATIKPQYLDWNSIKATTLAQERLVQTNKIKQDPHMQQKPTAIIKRIVEGRVRKGLGADVLLEQPFVLDPNQSVRALLQTCKLELVDFMRLSSGQS